MELHLKNSHLELLRQEKLRVFPIEACGLLLGELSGEQAFVNKVILAKNKLQSDVNFEIDPRIIGEAFSEAEKEGLVFIGFFHSHPAPAIPSKMDLKSMRFWSESVWLILSSNDNSIAAYRMKKNKLERLCVRITQ